MQLNLNVSDPDEYNVAFELVSKVVTMRRDEEVRWIFKVYFCLRVRLNSVAD